LATFWTFRPRSQQGAFCGAGGSPLHVDGGRRHACVRQGDLRIRGPGADELAAVALRALQGGDHTSLDRNPIDVALAGLRPDLRRGVIPALLASATYDVLVIVGS